MVNTQSNFQAQPIFVIGSARSGTSIIAKAIKLGTGIPGHNEGHFLPLVSFIMEEIQSYYNKRKFILDKKSYMISHTNCSELEDKILKVFRETCNSLYTSKVWIDKTPDIEMIKVSPYLLHIWSNSRFIYAKRRGIECINSRLKKFPQVPFKTHCIIWEACMNNWLKVKDSLNNQYIEIDQREIALEPQTTSKKIGNFLHLNQQEIEKINNTFDSKRPEFTGGKENIKANSIEEFGWSKQQIETFREICGSVSKKVGYSETSSYYL